MSAARKVRRGQRSGEGRSGESGSAGALAVRTAVFIGCCSMAMGGGALSATRMVGGSPSAPVLVLVPGGLPEGSRDLAGARERVRDAVGALVEDAASAGVVLAIEPMHPMYAADRGVVSTLEQALDVAEQFPAATVGVVVDTVEEGALSQHRLR